MKAIQSLIPVSVGLAGAGFFLLVAICGIGMLVGGINPANTSTVNSSEEDAAAKKEAKTLTPEEVHELTDRATALRDKVAAQLMNNSEFREIFRARNGHYPQPSEWDLVLDEPN